jgi:hypothetical protein
MLSSVLNSERAIQVNIQIMRVFIKIRQVLLSHTELKQKINAIEKKMEDKFIKHDIEIKRIFDVIRHLLESPKTPTRKMGFIK